MTTCTIDIRRSAPTIGERALLWAAHRLEASAVSRMERRAVRLAPAREAARTSASDRRAAAQALGGVGILPD
ncbi:MAG: hypothetical protein GX539_15995 [Candidatus Cloacimonetes bacterium]|nr:hypothetical protein [Candidatus Cloacimonadota bacterium]